MHDTIGWSYDLVSDANQVLLGQVGGFAWAAAEEVGVPTHGSESRVPVGLDRLIGTSNTAHYRKL